MKPVLLGLLLQLLSFACTNAIDQHASTKIRFNKSFFELASGKAKSIIDQVLPEIFQNLPYIKVTTDKMVFLTHSINMTHFDFPKITFSISKDGLTWKSEGGKVEMEMDFDVTFKTYKEGPRTTQSGSATIFVENLVSNLNAFIKTENSRPQLVTNQCAANVDKIGIIFHSELEEWVRNAIREASLGKVKNFINDNICVLVANSTQQANDFVKEQPEEIHIWKSIYLNYTAAKDPIYHDDYIEAECSFRVAVHDKNSSLELEDDSFVSFIPSSMKLHERTVFTCVLIAVRDVLLYGLAFYGIFSALQHIIQKILRRKNQTVTLAKAYENEALAAL